MSVSMSASISSFMSRAAILAAVAAAIVATPDGAFAFGRGGGMGGHPVTTGVAPIASYGPTGPGGGLAHPLVRPLSGRGVVKCIRACMHGVDASWAGFCEYSCAGP